MSEQVRRYKNLVALGIDAVKASDYDALHAEVEARLEREQIALAHAMDAASEAERLRTELEAARGLLERVTTSVNFEAYGSALHDAREFLTTTLTPEAQQAGKP